MDQINSSMQAPSHDMNTEQLKMNMQEAATEFLNSAENQKRIRTVIGRGQRLSVNIDEVRHFNPRLAGYIKSKPIEAIKIFEDQLN